MPFPILIENTEAIGELRGQSIRVSTLAATSLLLASRGLTKYCFQLHPVAIGSSQSEGCFLCLRSGGQRSNWWIKMAEFFTECSTT
jgi:hypothetical protein